MRYPSLLALFAHVILVIMTNAMAGAACTAFPITNVWENTRINND